MNRKSALIFLLVIGFSTLLAGYRVPSAHAIIWVEGHITSDTTWSPVDTYRVINNTYVDSGVTLTILPGVHVQFADGFSLIVDGSLNATGTDTNPIVFTSSRVSPSAGVWNTIDFKGSSNCSFILEHVRVEYAVNGITVESQGSATVVRSEFYNCSESGIMIKGISNIAIEENIIEYCKNGIATDSGNHADIVIAGNTISSNNGNGITLSSSGSPSSSVCNVTFLSNTVSANNGNGIYLSSSSSSSDITQGQPAVSSICNVTFTGNVVSSNSGDGIYLSTGSYSSWYSYTHSSSSICNVTFTGNVVSSNSANGIYLSSSSSSSWSSSSSSISNVTFSSNTASSNTQNGIYLLCTAQYSSIHNVTLSSNAVFLNMGNGIYLCCDGSSEHSSISNVTFSSNTASSNTQNGIYLYCNSYSNSWSTSSSISNVNSLTNTASLNKGNGIFLYCNSGSGWGSASSSVFDIASSSNTVLANSGNGIYILSSSYTNYGAASSVSNATFFSDNVLFNAQNGVYLSSSSIYNVAFLSNTASSNTENGIYLQGNHNPSMTFDTTVVDCKFGSNKQSGICIQESLMLNATRNAICFNLIGVLLDRTTANLAYQNDIYSNTFGMNVTGGATINAEHNYWGDTTGPYNPSINPDGKGNPANGNGVDLDFIPFLTSPQGHINQRPVAALSVDKITPNIDETVTLDATNSTDDGRIDYYLFNFGDGTNSSWTTLPAVTHKYALNGTYYATVTVMDDYGVTSTNAEVIKVQITVVPEFPSFLILPLFMMATSLAILVYKRKHSSALSAIRIV